MDPQPNVSAVRIRHREAGDRPRIGRARRSLASIVATLALASLAFVALAAQPPAVSAATPKALINGDTVSGSPSTEETLATAAGFAVTVVDGATWSAMTAAQFASYQVLIAGDPTCGTLATSFTANAATWAPVVMGTSVNTAVGNRIVIGTDPVFHRTFGSHLGADKLIKDGIAFAGALAGRTGVYIDFTCGDNGQGLSVLDRLSIGTGTWTQNISPPCGGEVSLIAANAAFSDLTSADLQGWNCSAHETFPTFRSDWNALAVATDTPTMPTCGSDPGGPPGNTVCGEAYVLIAGVGTVVVSPNITVTPAEATNPVGGSHTVTATVTKAGAPVSGQKVNFTVTGQNAGVSGTCSPATCNTNASGKVTFTYSDINGAGDDTITASFTDSGGSTQQATAIKHWVTGPSNTPTTCVVTAVRRGPPAQQDVTVTDLDGIASITAVNVINGTVAVPAFTPGVKTPIVLTATKTNQTKRTFWEFDVTDSKGVKKHCV